MNTRDISHILVQHYSQKFAEHGERPEGVDWGVDPADHRLRLERMLAVTELGQQLGVRHSILDVGCGYGSLLALMREQGLDFAYTGIDLCEPMISAARKKYPSDEWIVGDVVDMKGTRRFDYVVCNGILTQKLGVSIRDMDQFLKVIVRRIFELCRIGVAFNLMTTHVNFMSPNLYYRNPSELLAWCMSELTPRIRLDHAYPLFEYTIYLYRENAPELTYGAHRGTAKK